MPGSFGTSQIWDHAGSRQRSRQLWDNARSSGNGRSRMRLWCRAWSSWGDPCSIPSSSESLESSQALALPESRHTPAFPNLQARPWGRRGCSKWGQELGGLIPREHPRGTSQPCVPVPRQGSGSGSGTGHGSGSSSSIPLVFHPFSTLHVLHSRIQAPLTSPFLMESPHSMAGMLWAHSQRSLSFPGPSRTGRGCTARRRCRSTGSPTSPE